MSFRSTIMAVAAMFVTVNAHVKMSSPVPFSVAELDTAPISADQYPCKNKLGYKVSKMNEMKVGEKNTLALDGSAVHGGGSCQLSVTLDTEPTKASVFKVIMSMEGGCPNVEGKANSYDFVLPDSIPNGNATFAWTWMSKLSGGPELYMNCAPISVTGGASDKTKFEALPDMLKINIDESCRSVANFAVQFPNPGQNVIKGATNDLKPPVGASCGSSGSAPADSSSPAGGAPSDAPSAPAGGAPSSTASSPAASQPSAAPTTPSGGKPSPPPSNGGGGVFAPGASSGPALPSTSTTLVTVTATPTAPTGSGPTAPAGVSPPSPIGTGTPSTPSSPSAGGGSGTCTTNGAIMCNGANQFGLCNNGNVVWQAVASGTTCVNGSITKRAYYGRVARPRRSSRREASN
ncbi:glycoside hydrolase [Pyrenophora seminiperda CCB06]|uniref:Glycoside hydrolase n=1 Tax=Pyrenophora seminiperda CCB06 TaxID=1302712 RepID=A0A3M7MCP4_9PLEO|nr:glycoside hydrolase [Pyrenophora seminiperda CCB06]